MLFLFIGILVILLIILAIFIALTINENDQLEGSFISFMIFSLGILSIYQIYHIAYKQGAIDRELNRISVTKEVTDDSINFKIKTLKNKD